MVVALRYGLGVHARSCLAAPVFAAEEAFCQGTVGNYAYLVLFAHRFQVLLELLTVNQVVMRLERVKTHCMVNIGTPQRLDEPPGGIVGCSYVAHFACPSQVIERLKRFIDGSVCI